MCLFQYPAPLSYLPHSIDRENLRKNHNNKSHKLSKAIEILSIYKQDHINERPISSIILRATNPQPKKNHKGGPAPTPSQTIEISLISHPNEIPVPGAPASKI